MVDEHETRAAPAAAGRARRVRGGFTILELALSLLALSVGAALSISAYFSRAEITLDSAVDLLVDDLRLVQAHAFNDRAPYDVVFAAEGAGYKLERNGEAVKVPWFEERRYDAGAVFEGVRVSSLRTTPKDRIHFDDHGMPSTGATITLEYHGETRVIVVDEKLGLVHVDDAVVRGDHGTESGR
jgi:hypothetical protein